MGKFAISLKSSQSFSEVPISEPKGETSSLIEEMIPTELLVHICSFLGKKELCATRLVNRSWKEISEVIWKNISEVDICEKIKNKLIQAEITNIPADRELLKKMNSDTNQLNAYFQKSHELNDEAIESEVKKYPLAYSVTLNSGNCEKVTNIAIFRINKHLCLLKSFHLLSNSEKFFPELSVLCLEAFPSYHRDLKELTIEGNLNECPDFGDACEVNLVESLTELRKLKICIQNHSVTLINSIVQKCCQLNFLHIEGVISPCSFLQLLQNSSKIESLILCNTINYSYENIPENESGEIKKSQYLKSIQLSGLGKFGPNTLRRVLNSSDALKHVKITNYKKTNITYDYLKKLMESYPKLDSYTQDSVKKDVLFVFSKNVTFNHIKPMIA
jgi:hypothetical protein